MTRPVLNPSSETPPGNWLRLYLLAIAGIFAVAAVYLVAVAREQVRADVVGVWRERLETVAEDRAAAIGHWIEERFNEARLVASHPDIVAAQHGPRVPGAGAGAGHESGLGLVFSHLRASHGVRHLLVVNERGAPVFAVGSPVPDAAGLDLARRVLAGGDRALAIDAAGGAQVVLFAVPVGSGGRKTGAVVLHIDPESWLYPYLRRRPEPSASEETVLVGLRDGRPVALSPLRHPSSAPSGAVQPVPCGEQPSGGALAFGRWPDYRGVPVWAAIRPLAGTPWRLVVKADESEVVATVGGRVRRAGVALAGLALASALAGLALHRGQRGEFYRRLAASRGEFRQLFDVGPDAGLVVEDGVITGANRQAGELLGEGLCGRPLERLSAPRPDGATSGEYAVMRVPGAGTVDRRPWRCRSLAGREFSAEVAESALPGPGARALIWLRDVSDAQRDRDRLRLLVEGTPQFFFYVQDREGRVEYVSPSVHAITGRPQEEWLGQSHWFVTDSRVNDEARRRTHETLDGVTSTQPFLVEVRHADGRPITLEVVEVPRREGGRVVGLHGIAHDVTERRRAEASLEASEEKHRTILERLPVGTSSVRPDGTIEYVNRSLTRLLGYTVDEVPTLDVWLERAFPDPAMRAAAWRSAEAASAGERVPEAARTTWPVVSKDGTIRLVDFRVIQLEGRQVWTFSDVTPLADAMEALRASEERYRLIVQSVRDGIVAFDLAGRLTFVSPHWLAMGGYREEDASTRSFLEFVVPERRAEVAERFRRAVAGEPIPLYELDLLRADGSRLPVELSMASLTDAQGRVSGRIGVLRDLTERHAADAARQRAEAALRASEAQFRSLVERIGEGVAIVDAEERFLLANPAAERLLGVAAGELVGRSLEAFVSAEEFAAMRRHTERRLAGESGSYEVPIRRADGAERSVVVTATPLFGPGGSFTGTIGIFRDVTEEKRREEQFLHAQKMEAIGRLAGGVAHDFNNLLQAMLNLTQLLERRTESPEHAAALAAELTEHVRRGASLARQLLLFSRRQASAFEVLDLNAVVADTVGLLARLLPGHVSVSVSAAPGGLPVRGDRGQLEQLLTNLALNAADAMPEGGRIAVRTAARDGVAVLEVADTGHGIDAETMPHLFEPFFTTKGPDKGTGLGLSVVDGIVRQHGGTVAVESEPGRGALFRVTLPRLADGEAESARASERGNRVLVVEDEESLRRGLVEVLDLLGWTVTAAGSVEEAEAVAKRSTFDVVLTDFLLPGRRGTDLAAALRERWPGLRVVLMSGYTPDEEVRRRVDSGELEFLQKPFNLDDLTRAIGVVRDVG